MSNPQGRPILESGSNKVKCGGRKGGASWSERISMFIRGNTNVKEHIAYIFLEVLWFEVLYLSLLIHFEFVAVYVVRD